MCISVILESNLLKINDIKMYHGRIIQDLPHSRPEQGVRLKSEDQYLIWGIWSIMADFDPDFCDIFGYN